MLGFIKGRFGRWGQLGSAYNDSLTLIEKINCLREMVTDLYENEVELTGRFDKLIKWIEDEGITDAVDKKVNELFENGMLASLINETILSNVNQNYIKTQSALKELRVSVKDFGAVGDGVTDDTQAFKEANLYGYYKTRMSAGQNASVQSYQVYVPTGIYNIKGHKILGSPLAENTKSDLLPPITFKCYGDNATLLWDVISTTDELFFFDGTIDRPQIKGINIHPVSQNSTISIGGTVFKYHQNLRELGYANSSMGYYENVHVSLGRPLNNASFSTKASKVFHNTGYGMGDQTVVKNCSFQYFDKLYVGENSEAVNWCFENCGIFPGGFTSSVIFEFTEMFDNFNVVNCSFSMSADETMIKTSSTITNNLYTQSPLFNFNFDNNRIEVYGVFGSTWMLANMNFGRLNMKNTNMRLGSGSTNVKTIVKGSQLASFNFENITFNPVEIQLPIPTTQAFTGALQSVGGMFKLCDFITGQYSFKYTNGETVTEIQDVLVTTSNYFRNLIVENCTIANRNGTLNFEILNTSSELQQNPRKESTYHYSIGGVASGKTFTLPPYVMIKKIGVSGVGTLPTTYTTFRIYFGDKTLGNFVDVPNSNTSVIKEGVTLWEGSATVFNSDWSKQSITLYALNDGAEVGEFRSQLEVTTAPLDPRVLGITTNTNTVVVKTKV